MHETTDQGLSPAQPTPVPHRLALIVCGPDGPRAVPLEAERELVIGRHTSCQLSLPHPSLSRYHARFSWRAGVLTVEDLGSRHGTWVAGRRVERAELSLGGSVRLADIVVAVALDACAEREAFSARADRALVPDALYLSPRMRELRTLLHRVAKTNLPVLLQGETGTGKELAARELHLASARRDGPLRVLNCAAIPPSLIESTLFGHERGAFTGADRERAGVFEEARGGTVFLDEVGELSLATQAALLRVLESRRLMRVGSSREIEVDVRVVSATHRDLNAMADRGEFRCDILHRLCVVVLELPPLRSRREEIAPLASHFLAQEREAKLLEPEALTCLEQYDWPGNVRELRNVLARAAALSAGPAITAAELPEYLRKHEHTRTSASVGAASSFGSRASARADRETLRARLKRVERAELLSALDETGGNQRRAATLLGIPLRTFERRLRALRSS